MTLQLSQTVWNSLPLCVDISTVKCLVNKKYTSKHLFKKGGDDQKNNNVFLQISIDSLDLLLLTQRFDITSLVCS